MWCNLLYSLQVQCFGGGGGSGICVSFCCSCAARKLSQHCYNRKPLLKRVKKKLNQPPPLHTSFSPPSLLLLRREPNNSRIWSRILMKPIEAPVRGWGVAYRWPCTHGVSYGMMWALCFIFALVSAHFSLLSCDVMESKNQAIKECNLKDLFISHTPSSKWMSPRCRWSCQQVSAWLLIHTLTGNSHFQSQWSSDTRFPAGQHIFPFSFCAQRDCGSMFINCYAHSSVWVITRRIPLRFFLPDRTLIEVSDWVFIISGHHLCPSQIPNLIFHVG